MDRPQIAVMARTHRKTNTLRREGLVPLALCHKNGTSTPMQAEYTELRAALLVVGTSGLVELIEGNGKSKKHFAIAREIQRDPLTHHILNVSFQEVTQQQKLQVSVPLMLNGTPEAVRDKSGVLLQTLDHVMVEAPATSLPEHVEIDIGGMELGSVLHVSDILAAEAFSIVSAGDTVIATLTVPKVQTVEEPTAEGEEAATDSVAATTESSADEASS